MIRFVLALALAGILPVSAWAGSTIVYDGKGRVSSVVRDGPSGPIVYDGEGRLLGAVRGGYDGRLVVIRDGRGASAALGTTLSGGVGGN